MFPHFAGKEMKLQQLCFGYGGTCPPCLPRELPLLLCWEIRFLSLQRRLREVAEGSPRPVGLWPGPVLTDLVLNRPAVKVFFHCVIHSIFQFYLKYSTLCLSLMRLPQYRSLCSYWRLKIWTTVSASYSKWTMVINRLDRTCCQPVLHWSTDGSFKQYTGIAENLSSRSLTRLAFRPSYGLRYLN